MGPIKRPTYMKRLMSHGDKQTIKVISGLRRMGKSAIPRLYADELRQEGVGDERILMINPEEKENSGLPDEDALYGYVMERVPTEGTPYVMPDEARPVPGFGRVADSLFVKENTDVHITGPGAGSLSPSGSAAGSAAEQRRAGGSCPTTIRRTGRCPGL